MKRNSNNDLNHGSGGACRVAYLGPEATYSHQAAIALYGPGADYRGTQTIEDVFSMVEKGECREGVVPVENSYEGAVNITLDLFYKYNILIQAEGYLRIRHSLLSMVKDPADLKCIYSHPQALAQCREWIKNNLQNIELFETSSTALAAKRASEIRQSGAIGSRFAADIYGLGILREGIEDDSNNVTRFLVIGKTRSAPTGNDKTSIIFSLHHRPGALYNCLRIPAERNVNVTSIESRPMKKSSWEYMFFVDLEGHEKSEDLSEALKEMEAFCVFLKRLGSYPRRGALQTDHLSSDS